MLSVRYEIRRVNKKSEYSQLRVVNKKDIRKIGDFVYSTIKYDNIGLPRKFEIYNSIIK